MNRLQLHFGPVQSYVAEARSTADLWSGSFMLSHLAKVAYDAIIKDVNPISPILYGEGKSAGMESKFVGSTPNLFELEVKGNSEKVARKAVESWASEWRWIADEALKKMKQSIGGSLAQDTMDIWNRQVSNHWEMYWTIGDYDTLQSRKRLRSMMGATEGGRKCTQCGHREALRDSSEGYRDLRAFWMKVGQAVDRVSDDGSDRLCAICFIKRVFPSVIEKRISSKLPSFPSTDSFASIVWRARVWDSNDEDLKRSYANLIAVLKEEKIGPLSGIWEPSIEGSSIPRELEYEGNLFFLDRLSVEGTEIPDAAGLKRVSDAVSDLYWHSARLHLGRPQPYYAVLAMDGDSMGVLLRENEALKTDISKTLLSFAQSVPHIVEKRWGRVVYAGGDDVLALAPTSTVLEISLDIRERFKELFNGLKGLSMVPTISAGILVAHCMLPLQRVISQAHHLLEDVAKGHVVKDSQGNVLRAKDALAIELWNRGERNLGLTRFWDDGDIQIPRLVTELSSYWGKNVEVPLTSGFVYSASDLLSRLSSHLGPKQWERILVSEYFATRSHVVSELKKTKEGRQKVEDVMRKILQLCREDARDPPTYNPEHLLLLRVFKEDVSQ
ncbi:MAG: type III-B CRISPR-associated protein Cas10/Cmr2 [Candidatus Thorarchaeota archaeon]|nr:MAG: type III-B CRISPR-associated protein Cas10/Cmr2 [Candidatus Thorarchaeota archaeon]